jgi:hypothetical protein
MGWACLVDIAAFHRSFRPAMSAQHIAELQTTLKPKTFYE